MKKLIAFCATILTALATLSRTNIQRNHFFKKFNTPSNSESLRGGWHCINHNISEDAISKAIKNNYLFKRKTPVLPSGSVAGV